MSTHVELRSGAYADSVTLLQVSRTVQDAPGVSAAQVAMATPLNIEVLETMGFEIPASATPNDLVVALRLDEGASLEAALAVVDAALRASTRRDAGSADVAPHRTTASALRDVDDALVLCLRPRRQRPRRGDGRARRRPRRDDLQRQRAPRPGGRAQADGELPGVAGDGARLRYRRRRRPRSRLRKRRLPRTGRHRRRVRHRLPAAARAPRPCRGRGDLGARCRRSRFRRPRSAGSRRSRRCVASTPTPPSS